MGLLSDGEGLYRQVCKVVDSSRLDLNKAVQVRFVSFIILHSNYSSNQTLLLAGYKTIRGGNANPMH